MRCLNCHTVCMPSDEKCPSCGMQLGSYQMPMTSIPVTQTSPKPKTGFAIVQLLLGGVLLCVAFSMYSGKETASQEGARKVTAADLVGFDKAKELPSTYLAFTIPQSKDTGVRITDARLGHTGEVKTKFLLVQVKDRWMIVQVKPKFSGDRLEGLAQKWDSPMYNKIITDIVERYPAEAKHLLSYQFNAEQDFEGATRSSGIIAIIIAVFGALLILNGLQIIVSRPAASQS